MKRNIAWHFVGTTLRDGRPVPADGEWLEYKGPLVLCKSGLHWSRQPFDALIYAPGANLCLVEVGGKIVEPKKEDKGISSRRKIVRRMDATELLRYFARQQALSVLHLWPTDPPDCVLDYLMGDDAARAAASDAARDAAYAARDAASAAARYAAYAASDAAHAAAYAARAADYAASDAASAAAYAARDAAYAASDAAYAARDAASAAAYAARDAQNRFFNNLVYESFEAFL